MKRYMSGNDDELDTIYPPSEVFGCNQFAIPLKEYIHLAFDVSRRCGISMNMDENEDRYRFDFYLHASVIMGIQIKEFSDLIGGCDMFSLTICSKISNTIRASFLRAKSTKKNRCETTVSS